MERRTIMDIRMFMRMEQFMRVITITSRKIMLTVKKNMSQRTMFTVKKNTTQKSIFTARKSMIWKMWRFMMKITLNAKKLAGVLAEVLAQEDPAHAASYAENCASYQDKLTELDAEFREVVSHAKRRLVVFGDKFPLRYFFDEYGLEYRAAFSGCSTDTEPSAKTIAYLIDKVREEQIPAVYYLELSSPRVAEIIGEETGAEPLLFHSCHNVTRHQFDSGVTYLELMEQNVKNLKKGLS